MFLKEFEGRELFRKHGIPVAQSVLLGDRDDFREVLDGFVRSNADVDAFVLKAQILSGKRGKSGGVLFADRNSLVNEVENFFGQKVRGEVVNEILVQEKLEIDREFYVSIAIDRSRRCPVVIFSEEGGVDIEELAENSPQKILEIPLKNDPQSHLEEVSALLSEKSGLSEELRDGVLDIISRLLDLVFQEEALLAEINPLILSPDGDLTAVDAKIIIDNNALERHPDLNHHNVRGYSPLELEARKHGLAYVELEGDIAVIGNGAGLVMATLDAVDSYGGKPANFCDIGGGASSEMMSKAVEIVLQKAGVIALFINIFGGITHCDEVARGILDALKHQSRNLPIVIRMVGTNDGEAREILETEGLKAYVSFEEAAKKAASLIS